MLRRRYGQMTPMLGDQPLTNVTQRMDLLRKRFGQRFDEATLKDFVRSAFELPGSVELLVLRSNEMDGDFESNPETGSGLIGRTFQQICAAVLKLRTLGFQDAVIVTDHGFFLNTEGGAGGAGGERCGGAAGGVPVAGMRGRDGRKRRGSATTAGRCLCAAAR